MKLTDVSHKLKCYTNFTKLNVPRTNQGTIWLSASDNVWERRELSGLGINKSIFDSADSGSMLILASSYTLFIQKSKTEI